MKEWPRGEDVARVARSGGSGNQGAVTWHAQGEGQGCYFVTCPRQKNPLGGASGTRCCRFATDRTHQRKQFAQFRGLLWK